MNHLAGATLYTTTTLEGQTLSTFYPIINSLVRTLLSQFVALLTVFRHIFQLLEDVLLR